MKKFMLYTLGLALIRIVKDLLYVSIAYSIYCKILVPELKLPMVSYYAAFFIFLAFDFMYIRNERDDLDTRKLMDEAFETKDYFVLDMVFENALRSLGRPMVLSIIFYNI